MKKIVFIVLTGIIMFSCSSTLKVTSDVDPTTDFSAFKTLEYYGWIEDSNTKVLDFYKINLERSFESEFLNRGIKAVNKGEGDIIVSLHIIIETKVETVANTTSTNIGKVNGYGGMYGYGGFYGYGPHYGWGVGHPHPQSLSITTYSDQKFEAGTLIVSVYDAKKKELIWEAAGSKPLSRSIKDADDAENKMRVTVAEIMKKYPVRPKR
jgi:hypothetical protein